MDHPKNSKSGNACSHVLYVNSPYIAFQMISGIYVTGQQLPGIGGKVFILEVHKDSPLYQLAGGYFSISAASYTVNSRMDSNRIVSLSILFSV